MMSLGYYDSWYNRAPWIHKSAGMLLFALVIVRVIWRWSNPLPEPAPGTRPWEARVAHLAHIGIYLLLFGILISGYMIPTARGAPISVFGWFDVPALPAVVENQESVAGAWHEWLAWILMGLVVIHAAAAIKHHFFNRDDTLRRMLGLSPRK